MLEEIKVELTKPYMQNLKKKVINDRFRIPHKEPFRILDMADMKNIQMVIVGQDPYSTGVIENGKLRYHYDGVAFSSKHTKKTPFSLKVLHRWFANTDKARGMRGEFSNDLSYLVDRGILLINTLWSVSYGKPLSHQFVEWYRFTEFILKLIQKYNDDVVFLLLGAEAARMRYAIDENKHIVFREKHPAASRYKINSSLDKSMVLLQCMNNTAYPIGLLK